jgi:hypothetical protein
VCQTTHDAENWKAATSNSLENARSPQNLRRKKSAPQKSSLVVSRFPRKNQKRSRPIVVHYVPLASRHFMPSHAISIEGLRSLAIQLR